MNSVEYEYKFVRVDLKGGFFSGKPKADYQQTVHEQASQGWRFVQAFAPSVGYEGMSSAVDLIFERPR